MLLTKFFLILLAFLPMTDQWTRVNTDQHISFLMPHRPEKLQRFTNGISSNVYQTKNITTVFGVVCSDFTSKDLKITNENAQRLYEELKKGSLFMETAYLKNEKTIPYDNMIIKEIEYSFFKGDYEMTYFKRFIFRDNYVYQITIGGRSRFLEQIELEKEAFFNSISFPAPQPKTPEK